MGTGCCGRGRRATRGGRGSFLGFVRKQEATTAAVASIEDAAEWGERADALVRDLLGRVMRQRRSVTAALDYVRALSRETRANCWELALRAVSPADCRSPPVTHRCPPAAASHARPASPRSGCPATRPPASSASPAAGKPALGYAVSRSSLTWFYRVLDRATGHDPVRYHDILAVRKPRNVLRLRRALAIRPAWNAQPRPGPGGPLKCRSSSHSA